MEHPAEAIWEAKAALAGEVLRQAARTVAEVVYMKIASGYKAAYCCDVVVGIVLCQNLRYHHLCYFQPARVPNMVEAVVDGRGRESVSLVLRLLDSVLRLCCVEHHRTQGSGLCFDPLAAACHLP